MNWYRNTKTRMKLLVGFGSMLTFLLIVMITGISGMGTMSDSQNTMFTRHFTNARDADMLVANIFAIRSALLNMQIVKDAESAKQWTDQIVRLDDAIRESLNSLLEVGKTVESEQLRLRQLADLYHDFSVTRDQQIIPLILAGKPAEAEGLAVTIQQERFTRITTAARQLSHDAFEESRTALQVSESRAARIRMLFVALGTLALTTGAALVYFLNRLIAHPLSTLTVAASRIRDGVLDVDLPDADRGDEIGELSRSFADMVQTLRYFANIAEHIAHGDLSIDVRPVSDDDALGNSLLEMSESLKKMADTANRIAVGDVNVDIDLKSESDVLGAALLRMTQSLKATAAAADQIASGDLSTTVTPQSDRDVIGIAFAAMVANLRSITREITEGINVLSTAANEISTTAGEVAANASETAASIQQTTTTVEELKQTADLSTEKAEVVSSTSTKSVDISRGVKNQMQSITESIMNLSEQSQSIRDIIVSINDLAEQSNILAVNAAIESAKAAEQGKGFAVVAQEIRNLSDQSKQATQEVQIILNTIQKGTGTVIMATEQGSKAVDGSVSQAIQAGAAVDQISISIREQLTGVDQIVGAMNSIRTASSHSVAGTRQMEASAMELNKLGAKLKNLIETFTV